MRSKLLQIAVALAAAAQLSCGGTAPRGEVLPPPLELEQLELPPPDALTQPVSTWPDAVDLGEVVHSGILPSENLPPPPDLLR